MNYFYMNEQMIFKRYELKYRITKAQQDMLKRCMEEYMVPDIHGRNITCSLYFDTPDYILARRSADHPIYKEKIRLRSYGVTYDDTPVFLELKKKYDGVVYKRRIEMTQKEADEYLACKSTSGICTKYVLDKTQIFNEIDYCFRLYKNLAPACLISYQREAFYSAVDYDFRVTFDDSIKFCNENLSLRNEIEGRKIIGDDEVVMEVKTFQAIPMWMVHFLSENKIYKSSFSKYGTAYQLMIK